MGSIFQLQAAADSHYLPHLGQKSGFAPCFLPYIAL